MNIFKFEAENIINGIQEGKEPILSDEEKYAINNYGMRRIEKLTPLLM